MPFVPALRVAQVDFRVINQGERCSNTLYFQRATSWTSVTLEALGNEMTNWWFDHVATWTANEASLVEIYIRDLTTANSPVHTHTAGMPISGADVSTPPLPNNVSLCVSFRTGLAGRSFRGRNYIIGLTEGRVEGNNVGSSTVGLVNTAYEAIPTYATAANCTWVVISRYSGGLPRAQAIVTPVQNALIVDTVVDSQRRRLPGRGQ